MVSEGVLLPRPSAPQITSRIGKTFAQLLTSNAVLIAVGLAAVGGGRGWIIWSGAVEVRRRGGGRCCWIVWAKGDGSVGEVRSVEVGLDGIFAEIFVVGLSSWVDSTGIGCDDGEGRMVGVGGPDGKGVVSPVFVPDVGAVMVVVALLLASGPPYRWDFGTRIEASRRTVRWCARVAAALRVRKKRYCTTMGARDMKVVAREGSFSRRAQVR